MIQRSLENYCLSKKHLSNTKNMAYSFEMKNRSLQRQSPRGVLSKRCSENMQQIYRRTAMPKSDFNKDAKQLYWSHTLAWLFSCKFAAYFPNTSFIEHLWVAASLNIGIDSKFLLLLFFESEVNEILKFSPDNCLRWFENKKANWINTCDLCDSLRMIQLLVWIQHKMGVSYMRIEFCMKYCMHLFY